MPWNEQRNTTKFQGFAVLCDFPFSGKRDKDKFSLYAPSEIVGHFWPKIAKHCLSIFIQISVTLIRRVAFSLQAVHTPLQTPKSYIYPYRDMANIARRKLAAMVSTVDEAVHNVTYALRKYGYYRNSVIIYSTDNGAQPFTGGSNWPLRGRKVEIYRRIGSFFL